MSKLIKLTYQQIIDNSSDDLFEKAIFHTSYKEFIAKSKIYNRDGKITTFAELKEKDGRANSLHYKLTFATGHILDSLNNKIPNLFDQLGNRIQFKFAELNLIDSSIEDETLHKIKVLYTTDVLTLHEVIGEYLLLSTNNDGDFWGNDELKQTFMVKSRDNLTISAYSERQQRCISEESVRLAHGNHLFSELGMI